MDLPISSAVIITTCSANLKRKTKHYLICNDTNIWCIFNYAVIITVFLNIMHCTANLKQNTNHDLICNDTNIWCMLLIKNLSPSTWEKRSLTDWGVWWRQTTPCLDVVNESKKKEVLRLFASLYLSRVADLSKLWRSCLTLLIDLKQPLQFWLKVKIFICDFQSWLRKWFLPKIRRHFNS